jgi:hypothetical protein
MRSRSCWRRTAASYASSDPVVLSHARALATSTTDGAVAALDADPHYPRTIIAGAAETLDLGRPVAVLLMATLAFVLDEALAAGIVQSLVAAVPAGSYVALHHQASDMDPGAWVPVRRWNAISDRSPSGTRRPPPTPLFEQAVPVYGAVARKS